MSWKVSPVKSVESLLPLIGSSDPLSVTVAMNSKIYLFLAVCVSDNIPDNKRVYRRPV
jgi:hypothetical protein